MRWSLLILVAFLTAALPLYEGVNGGRVVRDDGNDLGLLQKLFNAIMGGGNDNKSTSTTTSTSTTLTSTTMSTTKDVSTSGTRDSTTTSTTTSQPSSRTGDTTTTQTTTTTTIKTATTTASTPMLSPECRKSNDLMVYCNVTDEMGFYLHWDTSADNVVSKVFSDVVINQLLTTCKPGDWCLSGDYIKAFSDNMGNFFSSPMCEQKVQNCVDDMVYRRAGCPNMLKLATLDNSLTLLCNMLGLAELTPECFGHTIATLHITLADEIRSISKHIQFGNEFCLGAYVGMTRKFMCTLEKCPNHEKLFRDFTPWQWFMGDAPAIKEICHLDSVCGDKELLEQLQSTTVATTTPLFTTTQTQAAVTVEEQTPVNGQVNTAAENSHEKEKPIFIIQASDESTRLLIGIVTGTLIGVLGLMVLLGAIIKRLRRRHRFLSKDGYSKLQNDETD